MARQEEGQAWKEIKGKKVRGLWLQKNEKATWQVEDQIHWWQNQNHDHRLHLRARRRLQKGISQILRSPNLLPFPRLLNQAINVALLHHLSWRNTFLRISPKHASSYLPRVCRRRHQEDLRDRADRSPRRCTRPKAADSARVYWATVNILECHGWAVWRVPEVHRLHHGRLEEEGWGTGTGEWW